MHKSILLLSLFLMVSAFKCSVSESSKNATSSTTNAKRASESSSLRDTTASSAPTASTTVSGQLHMIISNGMLYGEIKNLTEDKVLFEMIDYGQEDSTQENVEHTLRDGLLIDNSGEIGAPITVYVKVDGRKFPCSKRISHNPEAKFCNHLVLTVDDVFASKLAKDADFRKRFGAMLGKTYEADPKNPFFKVGDVR